MYAKKHFHHLIEQSKSSVDAKKVDKFQQDYFLYPEFFGLVIQDFEKNMSPNQKRQLQDSFSIVFSTDLKKFGQKIQNNTFSNLRYTLLDNDGVSSTVEITSKESDKEIVLLLFLKQKSNQWFINDLAVDGARLSRNYRAYFNKIFRLEGFEGLLSRLNQKIERGHLARR